MPRLLLAVLIALLAPAALAQTCTTSWTNPAGGAWETAANWSDGTPDALDTACITLAGTYTVAANGADRTVAGLVVGGGSGVQTLTTISAFTVAGNGVVRPSGRWELLNRTPGGQDGLYTTGTVTVEGVFVQNGGTTLLDGGGTLDVAPGGRWLMRNQASAGIQARPGTFRLRGTLDAAYTSTQTVEVPLDVQGGTVRVSQGRLDVRGGTLAGATVDAAAGAQLLLIGSSSAPFTVSGTLSGAPAGDVSLNGGTVTATSGEATFAVGGAGLLLDGNVVLTGGAFRNTGLITVAGGGFNALDGTTLRNTGRFVMPGRTFSLRTGARLRNEASGTIEISNQGGIGSNGGVDGRIENAGLLLANGTPAGPGSGATAGTVSVPYDGLPGSVVRTQTGRLDFQTGGTLRDATFDVPTGTVILLGAVFVAEGTVGGDIQGDLQINTELRAAAAGATLAFGGTGLLATRGSFSPVLFTSAGGSFRNTGLLRTGGLGLALQQVVLENAGTVRLETRFNLMNGALLRNLAGATVELYAFMEGDGRFENAGLVVTGGTGFAVNFGGRLRSLPGSEIRALRGGPRLDLDAPGSRSVPDGTTITGTGRFLLPATLDIEGAVSPGTAERPLARLEFFDAFRLSLVAGRPRVVVDVDAGGRSDTLAAGNARLGGTLVVRVRPGYTPAVGDQWTVVTAGSGVTGQFSQVVAEGAPAGIAFVAERAANGASLVLRAAAVAAGGAITVSTAEAVSGGRRTLFLSGPGVAGITSARLVCRDCLDAAAFGTFDAEVSGTETLKEARFDLTSPRAFGFFDLVVQRPGQPDAAVPVTVRPYVSAVFPAVRWQTGIRIRPASAPGQNHNYSRHDLENLTNGPAAFPFTLANRPAPDRVGLILASSHAPGAFRIYDSDATPSPLAPPLLISAVPANGVTDFEVGLRIDPDAVRFPEQMQSGPDDDRIPFGEGRPFVFSSTPNTTFERAAFTVRQGFLNTADPALRAYVAQVAAVDPDADALEASISDALSGQLQSITDTPGLLALVLEGLGPVVPVPQGLAASAAPAFRDSLVTAVNDLVLREARAYADAQDGSPAVRGLYTGELTALGLTYATTPAPRPAPAVDPDLTWAHRDGGYASTPSGGNTYNGEIPTSPFCSANDGIDRSYGISGANGTNCPPPSGALDPNDKLADTDLTCEFGTVVVDGQPQARCVRYFVPRARATEPVFYTVKFENQPAATAAAEFVTITDEIDPALNLASLRIEATSSDSTFSYSVSGRTVTFRFVGIDLPPNRTAPEGEGFVRFSLRPNAGLPDGTEIRNAAGIVFDFNPAIATPTVLHEIRTVADLATSIVAPDFVVVGTPVPLRVLVSNLRGDAATEARVVITTGTPVASVTASTGACTGTGPVTCTFGDLEAGATATIDLALADLPVGQVTVSAVTSTTAFDGFAANDTDLVSVGIATVGTETDPDVPRELTLSSPRPNPAHGATTLRWGLPAAASVDVRVYDLLGREVARIADGETQEAGWHETRWDAQVASGVYIVRVRVGDDVRTRRMTVIR